MTTSDGQPPDGQSPAEERPAPAQASTGPTVTTAPPPRAGRRWSRLPTHVGPARTSTIVLAVLFVGIFVLWLYVRPPAAATAGSTGGNPGTGQQVQQPAPTSTATPTPTETTTPTTSADSSSTGPSATTTSGRTATTTPTGTKGAPTAPSGGSTSAPSLPTSGAAPTS